MTYAAVLNLVESWAFWIIVWAVVAPVVFALSVAGWYKWHYQQALRYERKVMKGLRRKT